MYLYPTFLEDKCDPKIINIVCDHMNDAAIASINYLIEVYESIKGDNPSKSQSKEARKYLDLFFPEQLKGERRLTVLNKILDRLKSPVLGDLRDEYVYIIYQALINLYEGTERYNLEKRENEDLNIYRIQDDEKRDSVIDSIKENMEYFKSFYHEEDEDYLLFYLMESIENINSYEHTLIELVGDADFLDFIPIEE